MNFIKKWGNLILATALVVIGFISVIADSYAWRRAPIYGRGAVVVNPARSSLYRANNCVIVPAYRNLNRHWVDARRVCR